MQDFKNKIYGNQAKIPFAHTKITRYTLGKYKNFVIEENWGCEEKVEVSKIVGTIHPDYIGLTWLQLIEYNVPICQDHLI
jgi:hypothetical protein